MTTITTAYTATGNSAVMFVDDGQSYTYEITGTFVGTWVIETTRDQTNFVPVDTGTGTQVPLTVKVDEKAPTGGLFVRTRCSAFTSGTLTAITADVADAIDDVAIIDAEGVTIFDAVDGSVTPITRTSQKKVITSGAKVGGTAGAVVDAANDKNSLVKVPASQTASTVVVKIPDLKVGDIITTIGVYGQLESAGGAVTVDAILRAQTAVAADNTDAAIGSGITQISKTADFLIDDSETGLSHTVIAGNSYYILLTVTTAASTDVDILGVTVTVTEN